MLLRLPQLFFTILLSLWLGSVVSAFSADNGQPIVSASEVDYPPYAIVNEHGEADGFSVELLRAALKEVGHSVTFVTGPWAQVKQSLVDGQVQVLPLVGRTPEREAVFDFTFPYLTMHGTLVVRDDDEITVSLADLKGKRIAVMRGDNAEEFVRRSRLAADIITTETFVDALRGLSRGDYDAVVMQKLLFFQLAKTHEFTNLKPVGKSLSEFKQSFCFAVRKGDHQLQQVLNEGLALTLANGTFDSLYKKWITPLENPRSWKSRILIGGDSDYPPYEYLDDNGQPAGYNVELTRAIAKQMHLQVEIRLQPWEKIREELASGKIDIVQGMFYSPERDKTFDFSPAHTTVSHVPVGRMATPLPKTLEELDGKTVAVMAGDIMHDLIVARGKAKAVITTDSQESALALLAARQCDYALVARLPALFWIEKHRWNDLFVGNDSIVSPEYCYAAQHDNTALLTLFNEGLSNLMASGEYRKIYQSTLAGYEQPDTAYLRYLALVSAVLLILLVAALVWTRTLRKQVRNRTVDLETEIAERKKLYARIAEREKTINLLLNSTAEGIYGVDANGACTFFNKAAQKLLGYDDRKVLGEQLHHLLAHTDIHGSKQDDDACRVRQVLTTGHPQHKEDAIFWKQDGDWIHVEYFIHPILNQGAIDGAVVTFTDISEKKKNEEQRIRSAQMSSLGELAAGVAHEINNPVGGVINYAQILLNKHAKSDLEKKLLGGIIKEGERIAAIVGNLLNFVHKDRNIFKPLDIEDLIDEPLALLQQQLTNEGIFIDIALEQPLPQIYGNAQKLEQVLLNLISNARHALNSKYPQSDPNKILRISAATVGKNEHTRVQLTVWDQGCGIAPENLERVFNRFYTTKPAGVGTGLGLSIVHDILEEHGARIEIESEEGLFTKVVIEFPVCTLVADGV